MQMTKCKRNFKKKNILFNEFGLAKRLRIFFIVKRTICFFETIRQCRFTYPIKNSFKIMIQC